MASSSRILVAVSTPWAGEKLVGTIRDLAQRLDATVIVTHLAQPSEEDETSDDTRRRGEQTLAALTDQLDEAGVRAEGLLLYGDSVARAVLKAARHQEATLVVLGLSGKGRVARLLGRDIPQRIMKHADVPVMLLPPDWSGTI